MKSKSKYPWRRDPENERELIAAWKVPVQDHKRFIKSDRQLIYY